MPRGRGMRRGLLFGGLMAGASVAGAKAARNAKHKMVNCTACGATNDLDKKFCGDCGGQLQKTCGCGSAVMVGKKFCSECGKTVS